MTTTKTYDVEARAKAILDYWFGAMDDSTPLNRELEPFATHFQRWYGKSSAIDASIRQEFEPDLHHVAAAGLSWDDAVKEWGKQPRGLLALTLLFDQFPRNMYRDTAGMYTHDASGLVASEEARKQMTDDLPLHQRMFVYVPLMHVENLTLQERMLGDFKGLSTLAKERSQHNAGFFQFSLDFAQRHVDVVRQYGRFPHRNELLGRTSTAEELEFLKRSDAYF